MIEITVISAEAKREESAIIKRQLEEKIAREKAITDKRIAELIPNVLKYCTDILNSTKTADNYLVVEFFVCNKIFKDIPMDGIEKVFDTVAKLLGIAGYTVSHHVYSKSWQTRSGRLGFFRIKW
jgi:hypothetical protein